MYGANFLIFISVYIVMSVIEAVCKKKEKEINNHSTFTEQKTLEGST